VERETSLLVDVTVALCLALAGGWLATRLKLPALIGYLAAGVLISPFTPGFVGDVERLRLVADIGVVLLLFAIGVQFSLSELARVNPRVVAAAALMSTVVFVIVTAIASAAGMSRDASLYIAAAVTISSSVVIVKLLDMRGETTSEHGRDTIAVSIVQDLIAVVLIVMLGSIAEGNGDGGAAVRDTALAGVKVAAFVGLLLFVGLRVIPLVLNKVAEERSRELFFVAIAVLVIGTALASEWAGLSIALGAFLAGIVVSESDLSHRVLGELLPTRDVFAVLFFVSAGMIVDPAVVRDEWMAIIALSAAIILLKPVVFAMILRPAVPTAATALLVTALLMPVGEFSFLLAAEGLDHEALTEVEFSVILTSAVISIAASPLALAGSMRGSGAASLMPAWRLSRAPLCRVSAGAP
jgi:CPA2 family monovalent cation:H+ antiporter-2